MAYFDAFCIDFWIVFLISLRSEGIPMSICHEYVDPLHTNP